MVITSESGFEFVFQSGSNDFSQETKTQIRRKAMKAFNASRNRTDHHAQHNLLQLPPDVAVCDASVQPSTCSQEQVGEPAMISQSLERTPPRRTRKQDPPQDKCLTKMGRSMPLSGIERLIQLHEIDLMDLSALTTVHIGKVASVHIMLQPSNLTRLLSCRQESYLSYAYSRYGHWPCLDDALLCLILKAQQILHPHHPVPAAKILAAYSRALASLQKALNSAESWAAPEVLCATEVLARFELLADGGRTSWLNHIWGAAGLLRLRGPDRYYTDFERSLFLSLAGPIICESFLNNKDCFLEEAGWKELRQDFTKPGELFSLSSPRVTSLALIMCETPGLGKRVTDVVCSGEAFPESYIDRLAAEARDHRERLLSWRSDFNETTLEIDDPTGPGVESYRRYEHLGTALVGSLVVARLLGAISPAERSILEVESLVFARELLRLEAKISPANYSAGFYLSQKHIFARGTLCTADIWKAASTSDPIIDKGVFEQWCKAIGRNFKYEA
ncbi:hypothetical protein S40285_03758 [Stachybotrys chlorohalonatus IBT 40285]|uniref:Transcription factor domain-containing protein n=1 Tax=Stachybotrys chlorohalonatus (strain IBT 40285) TaxID=1283841 RepID=A0A084QIX3_STAC4|nr:hypothetical protein S40285_03758 [Stachybotrys chlorohalonata IBT 40285]